MHSKNNNEEFMIYDNANDILDNCFRSLLSKRGSDFIFDSVQLLHYKCHKVNLRRDGSYIDSPN